MIRMIEEWLAARRKRREERREQAIWEASRAWREANAERVWRDTKAEEGRAR